MRSQSPASPASGLKPRASNTGPVAAAKAGAEDPVLAPDRGDPLTQAFDAALACAQAAAACADACVVQADKALTQCIRLHLDCADVCQTAAMVATRRAGANAPVVIGLLMLAEALCRDCAAEAERHALPACRRAADLARVCAEACLDARTAVAREQLQ